MEEFIIRHWLTVLFGALTTLFAALLARAQAAARKDRAEAGAVKRGVQALLRDRILQAYWHYMDKGCCPIYAQENIHDMYAEYKNLGGNGTISRLVEEVCALPARK